MRVILEDKPNGDIVFYNLDDPAVLAKLKDTPFTLKEGCKYKIKLTFRVQHDIVTGLKYGNYIYKIGIRGKKFGFFTFIFARACIEYYYLYAEYFFELLVKKIFLFNFKIRMRNFRCFPF